MERPDWYIVLGYTSSRCLSLDINVWKHVMQSYRNLHSYHEVTSSWLVAVIKRTGDLSKNL